MMRAIGYWIGRRIREVIFVISGLFAANIAISFVLWDRDWKAHVWSWSPYDRAWLFVFGVIVIALSLYVEEKS